MINVYLNTKILKQLKNGEGNLVIFSVYNNEMCNVIFLLLLFTAIYGTLFRNLPNLNQKDYLNYINMH